MGVCSQWLGWFGTARVRSRYGAGTEWVRRFQGHIPDKIVVAFVGAERYNGNYALNPLKFDHYNANTMSILVNDVSMPHRPLDMNFKRGQFSSALCNILREHPNVIIDAKSFNNGYGLFVFDVNPS